MTARHRGDPVAGLARLGEQPDLAADRLDLRRPVQPEHPAQRGRVDPGGALRAGLPQQGAEHALAQHRVQRVEPVGQLAVDGVRGVEQPGCRQRGQRQEQSRERGSGAPGEHRRRVPDQPERRQRPLGAAVDRIRQHRHLRGPGPIIGNRCRAILLNLGLNLGLTLGLGGLGGNIGRRCRARLLGTGAVIGEHERVAHTALRHTGFGGDGAVGRSTVAQTLDGGDSVGGEFRLAFGPFAFGEQSDHTGTR